MTGFRPISFSFAACAALAFSLLGCNGGDETRTFTEQDDVANTDPHDHAHEHAHGPHEGHLVELGGEDYHAEVTLSADRKPTVYLLAADAKTALPIEAESVSLRLEVDGEKQEFKLAPAPAEGEADGKSSVFTLAEGSLPESIQDAEGLEGEVVVTFGGTQYRGAITHDHGDHGHDH
jgi:hypothetical protein